MPKRILISAGEVSGDIHAANLIKNLKRLIPDISCFGIGGNKMREEGVELIESIENLSIIGVLEILAKSKHIHRAYKRIIYKVEKSPPDIAILVDYPGFNLTLAKTLKKKGIPIIYYITPQVWAWGKFRIYLIKKYIDKVIVILKFEEDLFRKHGIDATFVGHPLLDVKKTGLPDRTLRRNDDETKTIALLPGSRESEVKKMLPIMLKTANLISKEVGVRFVLLKSPSVDGDIYSKILEKSDLSTIEIKNDTHECLSISDFVFTSSGTATLESAIMERPMLITYRTSFLTAFLFKIFARTPFIGLVNIIAEREVVPEILQYDAQPNRLASEILSIISSKERLEKQLQNIRWVKHTLGAPGASLRAARIIEDFLTSRR